MKTINMEVGMGQSFRKAESGTNQYTEHLKPCLGIGIYNLDNDESYMGHYTDLSFFDFEEDLVKIRNDFHKDNLVIFCAGGSLEGGKKAYNESILEDRKFIEDKLKEHFPNSNKIFRWNSFEEIVNLYLDKTKKEFFVIPFVD